MENKINGKKINYKIWVPLLIAIILMGVGFYLYYFYPEIIPGMASINPQVEVEANVLLIGLDDMDSVTEGKISADSIVLMNLKTQEKKAQFSNIILQDKSVIEQLNGQEFDQEVINKLIEKVEEITAAEINYYFTISYQGFENMVNRLGGVEIGREEALRIPDLELDLKEGINNLTGKDALSYARWYDYRKDEYDRVQRQQEVIKAIFNRAFQDKSLLDLPELFQTTVDTFNMVKTNIGYNLIKDLYDFFQNNEDIEIEYTVISG
ncbi:MAG: LCP family protein [Halanaerobiales bacterium]|nr:LCP family protein [Halanaerobiales bacterium]